METVASLLESYGALAGIVITWIGLFYAWWKRRAEFRKKVFLKQVNVSLNEVRDGYLELRTLVEATADEVWNSEVAVSEVLAAAERTTHDDPFVRIDNEADQAYVNRSILNVLSERFAHAFLARALGMEISARDFVFGLTCERTPNIITRKLRVMVIDKDTLLREFGPDADPSGLQLRHPTHVDRVQTLQAMARIYLSSRAEDQKAVDIIELGQPITSR